MEIAGEQGTYERKLSVYGIVVARELGERYAAAFEGMETKSGQTIPKGDVIDYRPLHGTLDRVGARGLMLAVESKNKE